MTVEASAGPAPQRSLQVAVIVIAVIVALGALYELPVLFVSFEPETDLEAFAEMANKIRIVLAALLAGAAVAYAFTGRLRHAIVALAAVILVEWAAYWPAVALSGFELTADLPGMFIFITLFVFPVLAVAAIALAIWTGRLALATVLVALPTAVTWLGFLAFAIGVMIYGF
jgi:hypothetical protein